MTTGSERKGNMTELQGRKNVEEAATSRNGKDEARYCAICGKDATDHGLVIERFSEAFCSGEHAEQFVKEVRAVRVQAAATALAVEPTTTEIERPKGPAAGPPKQQGWKRYLKMGACCGAPLLALVFLAGGGGAVLGAAGALLPFLALLACPIGMFFMMRGMSKMGQKENPKDKGEEK
jgi:hypothetical protein